MKKARNSVKPVSADAIARRAEKGEDVSRFFKGEGRMVQPIQRVNSMSPPECWKSWTGRPTTSM